MKVKELIQELQKLDPEKQIVISEAHYGSGVNRNIKIINGFLVKSDSVIDHPISSFMNYDMAMEEPYETWTEDDIKEKTEDLIRDGYCENAAKLITDNYINCKTRLDINSPFVSPAILITEGSKYNI